LLRDWQAGASWSQVRRLVQKRRVMVSGNICVDEARRLRVGDVVKILAQSAPRLPQASDVQMEYVDQHVCVVIKPAGINTNREAADERVRRPQYQPSVAELLPKLLSRSEPRGRWPRSLPGPVFAVHRLDRDTGGLLVFARSKRAERHLAQQFRRHTVHRRYLAVVVGRVEAQTIETRLVRDRGDGRRGSTSHPGLGRRAVTHIQPLEHLDGYTLIECRLETGRTHQIRIHLAELGHPLCGEKVYNRPLGGRPLPDRSGAPRIALQAVELGFEHPLTGRELHFECPWPPDLELWLAGLRRSTTSTRRRVQDDRHPGRGRSDR
jgi:23S rRNA pseudouridine1911/1915/1917 synthase